MGRTLVGNPSQAPYDDISATPGILYYYWVTACSSAGCSDFSISDTGWRKLLPPNNVTASDGTYADKIVVSWDSSVGTTSYEIYRADAANGTQSLLDSTSGLTYDDTTATTGVPYYYWVKACGSTGCSDFSSYDAGWRNFTPPTNVIASDGTYPDKIVITWDPNSGASSYKVYRATTLDGTQILIGNPSQASFDDESVSPGIRYYYWVVTCNALGCSLFSDPDTGWAAYKNYLPSVLKP